MYWKNINGIVYSIVSTRPAIRVITGFVPMFIELRYDSRKTVSRKKSPYTKVPNRKSYVVPCMTGDAVFESLFAKMMLLLSSTREFTSVPVKVSPACAVPLLRLSFTRT